MAAPSSSSLPANYLYSIHTNRPPHRSHLESEVNATWQLRRHHWPLDMARAAGSHVRTCCFVSAAIAAATSFICLPVVVQGAVGESVMCCQGLRERMLCNNRTDRVPLSPINHVHHTHAFAPYILETLSCLRMIHNSTQDLHPSIYPSVYKGFTQWLQSSLDLFLHVLCDMVWCGVSSWTLDSPSLLPRSFQLGSTLSEHCVSHSVLRVTSHALISPLK